MLPSYETQGSRTTPCRTVEQHFGGNRAVAADRHPAKLRAHPVIRAALAENGVGQMIRHGEHRLAIAEHEVLGIHELARMIVEDLQIAACGAVHTPGSTSSSRRDRCRAFGRPRDRQATSPVRLTATFSGLQLGKNFANHGLFHFVAFRGNEAVAVFQAVILIDPVTLQAGDGIGNGVPIPNVVRGVFLSGRRQAQCGWQDAPQQRSLPKAIPGGRLQFFHLATFGWPRSDSV